MGSLNFSGRHAVSGLLAVFALSFAAVPAFGQAATAGTVSLDVSGADKVVLKNADDETKLIAGGGAVITNSTTGTIAVAVKTGEVVVPAGGKISVKGPQAITSVTKKITFKDPVSGKRKTLTTVKIPVVKGRLSVTAK